MWRASFCIQRSGCFLWTEREFSAQTMEKWQFTFLGLIGIFEEPWIIMENWDDSGLEWKL